MHGPPLQSRVVAANGTVLANCCVDPGAHGNEQGVGANQNRTGAGEQGQWAWHGKGGRHTQPAEQGRCRRTQPADDPTGTGLEETTAADDEVGRPRSKTTAADVGRPLAVQSRLVEGVRWCWPLRRRAQTYLPVSLPPIAFACHCTYPLPQFEKPNLAPTYFVFFCFLSPAF